MSWLNKIPLVPLIIIAIALGLAPITPEHPLWQKLKMLIAGDLVKAIVIFDLFLAGTAIKLLLLKLATRKHVI